MKRVQTDNGSEFTKQLKVNDPNDLTLFEQELEERGIEYQRIRVATPRHNGIDCTRFYEKLKIYCFEDGQKQLAVYQKTSDYWKTCLYICSPNEILASYDAEQKNGQ